MGTPAVKNWQDWLKFRCTGCGNCCKETIVMLTDHDVRRIVDGTGMAPRQFVRFFAEDEIKLAKRHPFWIRFANRRATMALRWGRDRCFFLGEEDRCTIYNDRPVACREHPFNIDISDTGAVQGLSISKVSECLYELDGKVTKRELAAVCRWNENESEEYQERLKGWNRRRKGPRTRTAFMKFFDLPWDSSDRNSRRQKSSASAPSFA